MEENAIRLLGEVRSQMVQFQIPHTERYESNIIAFLNQCPDDAFLKDATVAWDNEKEFDFLWDTPLLDCRFSIGPEETSWHFWAGVNTHHKEDECYLDGVGGDTIDENDSFAYSFFESIEWAIRTQSRKQNTPS